ncbi:MAG: hypothetical protein A2785_02440 [Candidatus Chisholmbacteria bacterium RIFCSPHIGHO2_01_FULL_49_18]|uniref:Glycosyltransferase subfamily 4-like N-terminal domain-containing protein n=2 Tax=Candidatus Chisholmiibacteriota TaxID=1817900 RepID=A0A1G1VNK1_9BACT|nr:MAG: hypothetical protein A2785_02440 [Candidatus Chisholmbacteria bacterium RIFCSPHIGHO2_01_FULL_49_18]OGY21575.1 MAG: hypothetical protein A3A65_05655 [Candidatus Chisholmbacteria bacterium RIFCSPLOWO2_01_FULL_49_14]
MEKRKILYLTPFPHVGGGETALLYLLESLDRKRFEPNVVVTSKGQVYARLKEMKIKTSVINLPGYSIRTLFMPGISVPGILRLVRLIQKLKPSLIHINHPTLAVYAGIAGKLLNVPVLATSHGTWDSIYSHQDLANRLFCDLLLPITPEVQRHLTKRGIIKKEKTRVVYLGVDANRFKPASPADKLAAKRYWNFKPDDVIVTMACRFDFTKNHLTFLKIADSIIAQFPEVKFLIAGDFKKNLEKGSQTAIAVKKSLDEYLEKRTTIKKNIRFTGFQKDMRPVFQATDVLLSSSLSETLPVSFLEGAACGLPLLAFENTSSKRIVLQGKNGYLAPLGRSDLLTEHLLKLLRNSERRHRFGKYSREHLLAHFTITRYVNTIESIYRQMIRRKNQDFRK